MILGTAKGRNQWKPYECRRAAKAYENSSPLVGPAYPSCPHGAVSHGRPTRPTRSHLAL